MKLDRGKLFTAFILAAAMVMISPVSSLAEIEEGSDIGIGKVEGSVRTDVYQVVLPTVGSHTFDFIIDPLELINQTDGARYGGKSFEKGSTLFFRRTDGEAKEDYSSTSNSITITNKGTIPVDVSLNVRMIPDSLGGIRMTNDRKFTGDTSASLYMAVLDGENIMPVGMDGARINTTLAEVPEGTFEYGYDKAKGRYTYKLKKNLDGVVFDTRSFRVTGAVNKKGKWQQFEETSPKIAISWKVTQKKEDR